MKVLYAIQATGNGHLSRARAIIPILLQKNIVLDLLVSGTQADVDIPYPIKYKFKGLSFIFGKKGGVDRWKTYITTNIRRLQKDIKTLAVQDYDLILNDFEPISAWACKLKNIPCISLSHQAAVLADNAPKPEVRGRFGRFILKNYAPTTTPYGLHFQRYDPHIFTPIIRQEIRNALVTTKNHYTVYLPAYSNKQLFEVLSKLKTVHWNVFSKHNPQTIHRHNITFQPITNDTFVQNIANCKGVLCGAGFETPAEALYLNKKLMVIPMKGQYEQRCNAAALRAMGVPVLKALKIKYLQTLVHWVAQDTYIPVDYPDNTKQIIDQILDETPAKPDLSVKKN